MNRMCKRLFSLLLAMILVFGMVTTAFAAEPTDSGEAEPTAADVLETAPEPTEEPEPAISEPTEPITEPIEAPPENADAAEETAESTDPEETPEEPAPEEMEPSIDPDLASYGFVSDVIEQKIVGIEEPMMGMAMARSYAKLATLTNCAEMDIILNDGRRLNFHIADEDGAAPWDNMNLIFCLESNKKYSIGSGHEGAGDVPLDGSGTRYGERVWYNLSHDQRTAIALILLYGTPTKLWDYGWGINPSGNLNLHNPNIGYRFATQALIWEITDGRREASYPYRLLDSHWYDLAVGQCTNEAGTVDHFAYAYNSIVNDMLTHNVIPSFTGPTYSAAPEISLAGNTATVTDANGVLSRFSFTDRDNVSFRKSGNRLTITAAGTVTGGVHTATATLPNPQASLYEVWYNQYNSSMQTCIKVSLPANDPISAYFKLKASTGSLSLKKSTEDGKNLGGWQFSIYADQACTRLISGPHTTDSAGNLRITGLAAGNVWVKETGHSNAATNAMYVCSGSNLQRVTITSGGTASVSFRNDLRTGFCRIVKVLANPECGTVEGWRFDIHKVQSNGSLEYVRTVTTGRDGAISSELKPGTYKISEKLESDTLWECTSGLSQTVTVEPGKTASVSFTNALRPGEIRIEKVNTYGQALAGVEFLLEWSMDGESWSAVTYTDAAIPQMGGCTTQGLTNGKLLTDAAGAITFTGLHPMLQYRLSETAALDGYALLTGYAFSGTLTVENELSASVRVVNAPVFTLSETGRNGFGSLPMTTLLCGVALITAWMLLDRKRASKSTSK